MENEDLDKEYILNICSELRRAISRLSYVGMGMSDELDHELNKLRKTIRQDDELPEIKKNIDRISNILRTLGENDDGNKQASEQLDVLSLLLKKQLPSQLRKQLKLIKKGSKSKDAATIVRAIVDVID